MSWGIFINAFKLRNPDSNERIKSARRKSRNYFFGVLIK